MNHGLGMEALVNGWFGCKLQGRDHGLGMEALANGWVGYLHEIMVGAWMHWPMDGLAAWTWDDADLSDIEAGQTRVTELTFCVATPATAALTMTFWLSARVTLVYARAFATTTSSVGLVLLLLALAASPESDPFADVLEGHAEFKAPHTHTTAPKAPCAHLSRNPRKPHPWMKAGSKKVSSD